MKSQIGDFEHCGIMHVQHDNIITLHQDHYVRQLHTLDMVGIDANQPTQALNSKQHAAYLSLLGGLSWLVQTRMDIAVYVCSLQRAAKHPTHEHYIR
jgi:hypothetical protein